MQQDMKIDTPDPVPALRIFKLLNDHGIPAALGGSGLMAALGLVTTVSDWDITTDASPQAVQDALDSQSVTYRMKAESDTAPYESAELFTIESWKVDLIVGFAVRSENAVVKFPTRVTGSWLDMPIADPEVWAKAYRMLGRNEPASLLERWLLAR